MPTTKAAAKSLRQSYERNLRNNAIKESLKNHIKLIRKAVAAADLSKAQEAFRAFTKAVDKAAQKRVIPKNRAARKKSRLAKLLRGIKK